MANGKCKEKPGNMKSGLDAKPLFLSFPLLITKDVNSSLLNFQFEPCHILIVKNAVLSFLVEPNQLLFSIHDLFPYSVCLKSRKRQAISMYSSVRM